MRFDYGIINNWTISFRLMATMISHIDLFSDQNELSSYNSKRNWMGQQFLRSMAGMVKCVEPFLDRRHNRNPL